MEKYLIIIEKSETGFSSYSPDVLGCIATGETFDQTITNMKSALEFHLQGLLEDGEEIPKPGGVQSYLDAEKDSEGEEYFITHIAVEQSATGPEESLDFFSLAGLWANREISLESIRQKAWPRQQS